MLRTLVELAKLTNKSAIFASVPTILMPQVSEIMDTLEPSAMNISSESSLQVSSSSPEVQQHSMALQVQVASPIQSRTESSASSQSAQGQTAVESYRRNRSRSRDSSHGDSSHRSLQSRSHSASRTDSSIPSHRGPGSVSVSDDRGRGLPPSGSTSVRNYDQRSISRNKDQQVHTTDQRSIHQHVHQHSYDQRSMNVQVGVDPQQVIHMHGAFRDHVHSVEQQAMSHV